MENWTDQQKRDLTYHYKNTHFKENNPDKYKKCHFKRQSISHLLLASQRATSNETTCDILGRKLQEYASAVDKIDGVNNYADGVLDLVAHNSNDAKRWTSKASGSELLRQFLQPLSSECHNASVDGCAAYKPKETELRELIQNKKDFKKDNFKKGTEPRTFVSNNAMAKTTPTRQPFDTGVHSLNLGKVSDLKTEWTVDSFPKGQVESNVSATLSRVSKSVVNQPAIQGQNKYQPANLFRTAGSELKLQNLKRNGPSGSGGSGGECSYGSNKRSLGGRTRSVNSKFVPPVKQENSQPQAMSDEEMEDERLRLIDPKLVELIRSEIMDYGPPVAWDDIAGLHFAKSTIQEIVVLPMLRPDIFTGLRRPPKGILLFGPPGTGKTLIGKCIASQSNSTFFNISASSLTSKWVGEGEKMVRTLFTLARIHQPAVVFIDEIDSLLSQRNETEHEGSRRIKTEFLVQLDGAGTGEDDRILLIGATNRPQELDEAARRRLVKRLYIPLPDTQARCQIIQRLMASVCHQLTKQQIEEIATLTDRYSGADVKVVCQEACLGPIRDISYSAMQYISPNEVRPVTVDDFKAALSRVRSSVSPKDLEAYITWDQMYGSGGAPK